MRAADRKSEAHVEKQTDMLPVAAYQWVCMRDFPKAATTNGITHIIQKKSIFKESREISCNS